MKILSFAVPVVFWISAANTVYGQGGNIQGTVLDPTGAVIPGATVTVRNALSGYQQSTTTDDHGAFVISNLPQNPYRVEVSFQGFEPFQQDVDVRTSVPIVLKVSLKVAGVTITVNVQAAADVLENVPTAHSDLSKEVFLKLPTLSPSAGLSDAITLTTPGVVADSNGFFHPLGDHAQTSFSIDGQPISDQQSKLFSTQLPLNAIASMELITGAAAAEYGDKTSLVVNAVTQSGLGRNKPFGSIGLQYGSFGTPSEEASIGWGNAKYGNFIVANTSRSGRFLDTPEFQPIHDIGNNETFFDHFDFKPNNKDIFHLDLMGARNWFQVPDSYDQPGQDQRQKTITFNVSPNYQHIFNPAMLLNVNAFFRQDQISYYPSSDPFLDTPATIAQTRRLTNYGFKGDISYVKGHHNLKVGTQIMQTRLREQFNLGITDPGFNAVCVDSSGNPQALPGVTDPTQCAGSGFLPNRDFQPGLIPYDLTRGGTLFDFAGQANINQFAFYAQDAISVGGFTISPGLRIDRYDGISKATGIQPRFGISYLVKPTSTVLRLSYSRTMETQYNENLILSSATGAGGLATNVFGAFGDQPLQPGRRNQFNAGLQQSFGRYFIFDGDYLWKYTNNAYDFDTLFSTPITFPISWRKSKIDGVSLRFGTTNVHGLQAYTTIGHTRARFFGPEVGGVIFNSPIDAEVFRIDHDQAFQQTTNVRYQRPKNGAWFSFTWRFDSGEVAGAVTSLADALSLTAAQQAAIGFFCGSQSASLGNAISSCSSLNFGSTRLVIPAPGTFNPDTNSARVASRHLFDLAVGTDNLFRSTERVRTALRFSVVNLTNKEALYNFLSTFSGTHFVQPRTYQAELRFLF
ncbi:MAG: TonB-dependent receptor [Acidobacteriia bacterium]|nr:TonB-dependent receptor [Terriglobia bacterium]